MSNYAAVRYSIRDGDLIAVHGQHLVDKLTRFITRSPVTHTGIAVWCEGHLFMADLNAGRNHLTALSCIPDFDVHAPPEGMDRAEIRAAVFDWLATPIDYGILAFLAIGLQCLVRTRLFTHWRRIIVCSGGSVQIYETAAHTMEAAGMAPPPAWLEHTRMLSPGELAAELPLLLQVRASTPA